MTRSERYAHQCEAAASRFEHGTTRLKNASGPPSTEWRKVEEPERVLHRLVSLNLHDIAGKVLASTQPADRVPSAHAPETMVSLLERIIEENDLVSSRFLHVGSARARAVGKIQYQDRGTSAYGTGFLISSCLVMTNNHVLPNKATTTKATIEFDYFERADGTTSPTELFSFDPERFFVTIEALDVTIVAVREMEDHKGRLIQRGHIPLISQTGKALVGEPVNIIQHPEGGPQQIAFKNNAITGVVDNFLHYEAATLPGSSGAAVFNMQWELAALHHAGVPRKNEAGRILKKDGTIWDAAQDLDQAIDWVANEGVRISAIVKAMREYLIRAPTSMRELFDESLIPRAHSPVVQFHTSVSARVRDGRELRPASPNTPTFVQTVFELDDAALDALSDEQLLLLASHNDEQTLYTTLESGAGEVVVAEGDSWFHYAPAGIDIVCYLRGLFGHRVHNVSNGGDTLDNMAWGTDFKRRTWQRNRSPLEETIEAVRRHQPRLVLLSGGGNDVAGQELGTFLNHKMSGQSPLREDFTTYMVDVYLKKAFEHIFAAIWRENPDVHVVVHGYGYAPPDGRGVIRFLGIINWIGPWLRPALVAKGYVERAEREQIVFNLIDRFNAMLQRLADQDDRGRIHYLDLRPLIGANDWANELHLTNSAYRRVARRFDQEIRSILT